jgi:hypothetical protein
MAYTADRKNWERNRMECESRVMDRPLVIVFGGTSVEVI